MLLSCNGINCEGSDWPITNYSAEGEEPFPPFWSVVYPNGNNPIDEEWTRAGCLYICTSYISQEDADLCALRQAILCRNPPGDDVWYSAPATCTATCPDGTIFYYTVPAGMFVAHTYAEALAEAQAYACEQAQRLRFCIGDLPRCACVGNAYNATVGIDVQHSDLTWTVTGILPPGLQLISHTNSATITGTPVLPGTYAFQLVATDAQGNYAIKVFTIQVVQITNNSLPSFVIGTPYSYQLTATGGSGNYSWRVAIGTLPDGLTLSTSGLISGTPTSLATGGTLTFEVIDTTCEAVTNQQFPPKVVLVTSGTTSIRTKRGWSDYGAGGTLYKTLTPTGYQEQRAYAPSSDGVGGGSTSDPFGGGARYDYSGFSQIDIYGNFISRHQLNLRVACPNKPYPFAKTPVFGIPISGGNFVWGFFPNLTTLLGYCWTPDPNSCTACSDDSSTWVGDGNWATTDKYNYPYNMAWCTGPNRISDTQWGLTENCIRDVALQLEASAGWPDHDIGTIRAYWAFLVSDAAYTLTLSDEYTDADALASAQVYTNNSAVAENLVDYRQWFYANLTNRSSRITAVNYALNCTNLVEGKSYIVRVELKSSTGASVIVPYSFVATGTTHQILATIPTPAANTTITVRKPSIVFAP